METKIVDKDILIQLYYEHLLYQNKMRGEYSSLYQKETPYHLWCKAELIVDELPDGELSRCIFREE